MSPGFVFFKTRRLASRVVLTGTLCMMLPLAAMAAGTVAGTVTGTATDNAVAAQTLMVEVPSATTHAHDAVAAGAAMATPAVTDWKTVLAAALARSPQQQVLRARAEQVNALGRRGDSLLADAPAVNLRYQTDQIGSDGGLREYEAGVELPLWRPGQRHANQVLARSAGKALEQSRAVLMLDVAGRVRDSVWQVALRQNNLALTRAEWQTAQALERDVNKRVQRGEMARADSLLAREESLRKQVVYLQTEAALRHAQDQYRSLTGLTRLPRSRAEVLSTRDSVARHPLLAEAEANVSQTRAWLEAVRQASGGSPQLLLGGRRERGVVTDNYVDSVGISLRLPLGTAAHTGAGISEAARVYAEALASRDSVQRRLQVQLHEAEHSLHATRSALQIAAEQNRLAKENLRLAHIAFSAGETDLVGLLRVQALAFAAQRNEQELKIMLQRAVSRYNQAVGVLP